MTTKINKTLEQLGLTLLDESRPGIYVLPEQTRDTTIVPTLNSEELELELKQFLRDEDEKGS